MSKTSHTPGKWEVGGHEPNCVFVNLRTDDPILIAECHSRKSGQYDTTEPEQVANARLIAASPQLLAACKAVLAYFDGLYCSDKKERVILQAAISAAEPSTGAS